MKDKVKKAMKRGASGLLAVLLAVCLVGTPRAKAVVSEGALLGSIFGSLLVSMGYSWAADNMDVPTFGDSIYKLTQEFDEAMKDTGNQLIRDLNLAGLTANGAGKLQFGYAWVQAARSFAEWFEGKYLTVADTAITIVNDTSAYVLDSNGEPFYLTVRKNGKLLSLGTTLSYGDRVTFSDGSFVRFTDNGSGYNYSLVGSSGRVIVGGNGITATKSFPHVVFIDLTSASYLVGVSYVGMSGGNLTLAPWSALTADSFLMDNSLTIDSVLLTAEKPQEVHYPDVAEDGSQVYEITVDGVTATDIEGIVQGAVDRILAGTAAIAGEVTQASTGEIVENPEIDPYKVGLSSVFPFCIPFDVYNMVTMFVAEPEAPSAEWTFTLPWSNQEYSVGWDLSAFDGVARVCRDMELVLFAVGLAVITYKVIKW